MKKKEKRNINGITLIALVVTIIVLIIIVGVSMAMLTGENGIITKAIDSSKSTYIATIKEKAQTDISGNQIENNRKTI